MPVGERPEGIAADPRTGRVAVALREPDRIALLDGSTGEVVRRVPVPGAARHLQNAEPGGPILVPAEPANALVQLGLPGGEVLSTTPVGAQPHDATQAGGRIFVADERDDTVSVVQDGRRVGRFAVARQPGGVAPVDGGTKIAVVSVRDRVVEIFDARPPYRRLGKANAGVGPTHVVSDGRSRVYVTDTAGDALLVFRAVPDLELRRRLAMPTSPYGIDIDRRRERLFVTLQGTNRLIKLWTKGPRTVAVIPTVRQPRAVAVNQDTGRAFVTGDEGVVQLVDPSDR